MWRSAARENATQSVALLKRLHETRCSINDVRLGSGTAAVYLVINTDVYRHTCRCSRRSVCRHGTRAGECPPRPCHVMTNGENQLERLVASGPAIAQEDAMNDLVMASPQMRAIEEEVRRTAPSEAKI